MKEFKIHPQIKINSYGLIKRGYEANYKVNIPINGKLISLIYSEEYHERLEVVYNNTTTIIQQLTIEKSEIDRVFLSYDGFFKCS